MLSEWTRVGTFTEFVEESERLSGRLWRPRLVLSLVVRLKYATDHDKDGRVQ